MKKVAIGLLVLLALPFLIFGLHWIFHFSFLPEPEHNDAGGAFLGALAKTGYMFPVIKVIELGTGVLLLAGLLVPLALVLLAPVLVNIVLYHVYLDSQGIVMGLILAALWVIVAMNYRKQFAGLLTFKPAE